MDFLLDLRHSDKIVIYLKNIQPSTPLYSEIDDIEIRTQRKQPDLIVYTL